MEEVVAVVVDNGEPMLERCVESLRDQSVPVRVVIAAGPRTDMELARSLADEVVGPAEGIGRARVEAILRASEEYILSCDSDTVYHPMYAEAAVRALRLFPAVRAGTVLPHQGEESWLGLLEGLLATKLFCYEFSLAFRRDAFISAGIHEVNYEAPRADIGPHVCARLLPVPVPDMVCWTRLPTNYARRLVTDYAYPIAGAAIPVAVASGVVAAREVPKILDKIFGRS